jgi:hypothetical protein
MVMFEGKRGGKGVGDVESGAGERDGKGRRGERGKGGKGGEGRKEEEMLILI